MERKLRGGRSELEQEKGQEGSLRCCQVGKEAERAEKGTFVGQE